MKKKYQINNDDSDLFQLMKIVWNGKFIILFITLATTLFAIGYHSKQEKSYLVSIKINKIKYQDEFNLQLVNEFIVDYIAPKELISTAQYSKNLYLDRETTLARFIMEILDTDRLTLDLEKNKIIKEKYSNLIKNNKKNIYNALSSIYVSPENSRLADGTILNYSVLNLVWQDVEEAKEILKMVIELSNNNTIDSYFNELKAYIELRKNRYSDNNLIRLKYLNDLIKKSKQDLKNSDSDQKIIESYVIISLLEKMILKSKTDYNNPFFLGSFLAYDLLFYLKGPERIQKEIEKIQNDNEFFKSSFKKIIQEIEKLDLKWVEYDLSSIKSQSLSLSLKKLLMISISIGLVFSIILVLILNEYTAKKYLKKI